MNTILFRGLILLLVATLSYTAQAQTTLLAENFDNCSIPNSWTNHAGAGDISWEIGNCLALKKTNNTCVAFLNDFSQATTVQGMLVSSTFDATGFNHAVLDIDIHFMQKNNAAVSVVVYTNNEQFVLQTLDNKNCQANQITSEHVSVDISKYIGSDMRIGLVYDNGGQESAWVAIDNLSVTADNGVSSSSVNTLINSFN